VNRSPISRPRSPWRQIETPLGYGQAWRRDTGDGSLVVMVAQEPDIGWHLSISFRDHRGELTRYPRWDEIAHARDELLPADRTFVMFLPPSDEYVALHDTTFHLHEYHEAQT
jgi:hypothetical protein